MVDDPPCGPGPGVGFYHKAVIYISGRQPKRQVDGSWQYPPMETAREQAGFKDMGEYFLKSQSTVTKYIAMRPILDLCEEMVRMPGAWAVKR